MGGGVAVGVSSGLVLGENWVCCYCLEEGEQCRTMITSSSPRPMQEPPKHSLSRPVPSERTVTSSSRLGPARWLKYLLQRLESMAMLSATLQELTFSVVKNWKILCHLHTTAMSLM